MERFHILFQEAVDQGNGEVEHKAFRLATGKEKELLTDRGHVQYLYDSGLIALGLTGEEAYLRDADGDPVPETVPLLDPEMIRFWLKSRMPEKYGNQMRVQVDHKHTGVLVVGIPKTSKELEETYSDMRHDSIQEVEFEEIDGATPALKIENEEAAS